MSADPEPAPNPACVLQLTLHVYVHRRRAASYDIIDLVVLHDQAVQIALEIGIAVR